MSLVEKLGGWTGGFTADFRLIAYSLTAYLVLSIVTYLWLALSMDSFRGESSFIAFDVATGGSPLTYAKSVERFRVLWVWLLLFRFASWVIVPVLTAAAVDAGYRIYDRRKSEAEQRLRERLREIGKELGRSGDELNTFVEDNLKMLREVVREGKIKKK